MMLFCVPIFVKIFLCFFILWSSLAGSGDTLEMTFSRNSAQIQVIHKQHPSSFTGTDLQDHLDKVGKKKIVLAGMSHSIQLPP